MNSRQNLPAVSEGSAASTLLRASPTLLHLGIDAIAAAPRACGANVKVIPFRPPAGGDLRLLRILDRLAQPPLEERINAANRLALQRILASQPSLIGIGTAREVVPAMAPDLFLHAGPPIEWARMSGPLRGAVIGGILFEGLARSPVEAERLAAAGAVRFEPCHHHQAVGPMAGLITPSMPVWILEDRHLEGGGRRTFCTLNEGLGKVLRYGAYSGEVLERLRFMAAVLAPVLAETLAAHGPIDLRGLMAQALHMGDEGHNRNRAGTSLLIRELAPTLAGLDHDRRDLSRCLAFMHANDHFFLNLTMPMAKCMLLAAEGIANSSVLTVMARNGTDFGIQLASMPGRWFTGPAGRVEGLYFPGYGPDDANPDIGDSAITETVGLGAFAMAAAPAIVQFVGGSVERALETSRQMARITVGRNASWTLPTLDFASTATGIDVRRVVELQTLPAINTGIAHRLAGIGQVGAGLVNPPWQSFHAALDALLEHCEQ